MIHLWNPSPRSPAAVFVAAFGLLILVGAAAPDSADGATELQTAGAPRTGTIVVGAPMDASADGGDTHVTDHGSDTDGGAAPWPEWAKTGAPAEDHTHDTPSGAPSTRSDSDSEPVTHDDHSDGTGQDVPFPDPGSAGHGDQGHDSGSSDTGGHGEEIGPAPQRPRALVLGSFVAVNSGVLLAAAFVRRRTRTEVQRRESARAAALRDTAQKPSPHPAAPAKTQP